VGFYLVTGGCGFIGSTLVAALSKQGHRVRVLDDMSSSNQSSLPEDIDLVADSTGNREVLDRALDGADGLFHLAAPPRLADDPRKHSELGDDEFMAHATTVFECAATAPGGPVPVVYASSAAVYGNTPLTPIGEATPTAPVNSHGAEKLAFEKTARKFAQSHGVRSWGLRMFNVYGENQSTASPYCSSVRFFAERIIAGDDIVLYGDGGQVRDFLHVDDAVACMVMAADNLPDGAEVANACTGVGTKIIEAVKILQGLTGKPGGIQQQPGRPQDVLYSVGDTSLAQRQLGFESAIDVNDGLTRMVKALS